MKELLEKLNYKGESRIALLNADNNFRKRFALALKGVIIDEEIDPRFPYNFIMIFVKNSAEVNQATPGIIHNLSDDGVLWFCFPKKDIDSDLSKSCGWKPLNDSGFQGTKLITIDKNRSALRFRHIKYIKE